MKFAIVNSKESQFQSALDEGADMETACVCEQCLKVAPAAKSQAAAVGAALCAGWSLKHNQNHIISGIFNAENLVENFNAFCPLHAPDFETES